MPLLAEASGAVADVASRRQNLRAKSQVEERHVAVTQKGVRWRGPGGANREGSGVCLCGAGRVGVCRDHADEVSADAWREERLAKR